MQARARYLIDYNAKHETKRIDWEAAEGKKAKKEEGEGKKISEGGYLAPVSPRAMPLFLRLRAPREIVANAGGELAEQNLI